MRPALPQPWEVTSGQPWGAAAGADQEGPKVEVKAVHFWVDEGKTVLHHQRRRVLVWSQRPSLGSPLLLPIALREEATEGSGQLLEGLVGAWMGPP